MRLDETVHSLECIPPQSTSFFIELVHFADTAFIKCS